MRPSDGFDVKGDNFLWAPALTASETVIELLWEKRLQHTYLSHVIVLTHLMKFLWGKNMGKEAELLFNVTVGTSFWNFGEHEFMNIALLLPIIHHRKWIGTWTIKRSE